MLTVVVGALVGAMGCEHYILVRINLVHRLNEQEEQASSFSWKEPLESESEERE
jgi:hypothetical protein